MDVVGGWLLAGRGYLHLGYNGTFLTWPTLLKGLSRWFITIAMAWL